MKLLRYSLMLVLGLCFACRVYALDELTVRKEIAETVQKAVLSGDSRQLEELSRKYRTEESRTPSGIWKLTFFQNSLRDTFQAQTQTGGTVAADALMVTVDLAKNKSDVSLGAGREGHSHARACLATASSEALEKRLLRRWRRMPPLQTWQASNRGVKILSPRGLRARPGVRPKKHAHLVTLHGRDNSLRPKSDQCGR
jgi:hypothetical protein